MSTTPVILMEQRDGATIATAHAKLMDADVCQALRQAVTDAAAQGSKRVVIDLSAVSFMPSMAIGVLMTIRKELHERDCPLVLAGAKPVIRDVLTTTKVDRLLTMADSVEQALAMGLPGRDNAQVGGGAP